MTVAAVLPTKPRTKFDPMNPAPPVTSIESCMHPRRAQYRVRAIPKVCPPPHSKPAPIARAAESKTSPCPILSPSSWRKGGSPKPVLRPPRSVSPTETRAHFQKEVQQGMKIFGTLKSSASSRSRPGLPGRPTHPLEGDLRARRSRRVCVPRHCNAFCTNKVH